MKIRQGFRPLPLALAIVLLSACGGAAPAAPPSHPAAAGAAATQTQPAPAQAAQPAKPLKKVTLRLAFLVGGWDTAYTVAQVNGYYKAAGLDVSILEGKGAASTTESLANGSDTFGDIDVGATALLISKGAPVKVIADFIQRSPLAFIHNPDVVIRSPKDLVKYPIISEAGSTNVLMLPPSITPYGVKMSQLKLDLTTPSASIPLFLKTPGVIYLGYTVGAYGKILAKDPKAIATPYGIDLLSLGLATSDKMIQQHPNEVRAFVAATLKGWRDAIADPAGAVQATLKLFPNAGAFGQKVGLQESIKLLHTKASQGHPLGWMAKSDWQQSLDILHKYGGMKTVKPVADYYTNSFIPAQG